MRCALVLGLTCFFMGGASWLGVLILELAKLCLQFGHGFSHARQRCQYYHRRHARARRPVNYSGTTNSLSKVTSATGFRSRSVATLFMPMELPCVDGVDARLSAHSKILSVSSMSGAAGSSDTEGKAAMGSGERVSTPWFNHKKNTTCGDAVG